MKSANKLAQNKDIVSVFVVAAAILTIPLVGMQVSDEWDWKLSDFVIMGTLLIGIGLLIVLASRKIKSFSHRTAVIVALLIAFLLTWAELAVGVFGTPFAGS